MYCKNLPFKKRLEYLMAEKQKLFLFIGCPNCDKYNNINFRNERIKLDGIRYYCEYCKWHDVIGYDIVVNSAKDFMEEYPYHYLSLFYKLINFKI